jgi:hypothetical protein
MKSKPLGRDLAYFPPRCFRDYVNVHTLSLSTLQRTHHELQLPQLPRLISSYVDVVHLVPGVLTSLL